MHGCKGNFRFARRACSWACITGFAACGWTASTMAADRTWQGGAATNLWSAGANWIGAAPPAYESGGMLAFPVSGTSRLDDDYIIGGLTIGVQTHTIELDGNTLITSGHIGFGGTNPRGVVSGPGTLRVGTSESPADIRINVGHNRFTINKGALLGGNIRDLLFQTTSNNEAILDLRGATMEGGELAVRKIVMSTQFNYFQFDETTSIDTLRVHEELRLAGRRANYIGNPAFGDRRMPANLNIAIGSDGQPAILEWGWRTTGTYFEMGPAHFNASTGGSFTGRLSRLRVGHSTAGDTGYNETSMDFSGMDVCDIETESFSVGTVAPGLGPFPVRVRVGLPRGTVRTGTLHVGRPENPRGASEWADLNLDATYFRITNSLFLDRTALVTVNLYGAATGLDVDAGAGFEINRTVEDGGRLHLEFLEPPDPGQDIYWGLRVAGDKRDDLSAVNGLGGLTATFDDGDPGFAGKHVGVLYTNGYTYFAMADEDAFDFSPRAFAQDRSFEVEPGGKVRLEAAEIDYGSFDPLDRPFTLTLNYDGQTGLSQVELTGTGPHTVTLVLTVDDDPGMFDQADATVTLMAIAAGTEADLIWTADATTALMDRREWFWGYNWDREQPPLNPSDVKLRFPLAGTSFATPLSGSTMKVGAITFYDAAHTIDIGTNTVTTGNIEFFRAFDNPRGTFAGTGTLRIGDPQAPADILISQQNSRLTISPGIMLGSRIGRIAGATTTSDTWLDLRGVIMENGLLAVDDIVMGERRYIYLDNTTRIERFIINERLYIGGRRGRWIGDPADAAYRRLPTNLVVVIGSEIAPAILDLGIRTSSSYFDMGPVHFNASTGGSFTGRLSRLRVGHSTSGGTGPNVATLDLAGMDGCDIETASFIVGTSDFDYWSNPAEPGPVRATVKLPPGTVRSGTLTLGRDAPRDAVNWADLWLAGTRLAVTNAAIIHESGSMTIEVGAVSAGLDLTADATFTVEGAVHIDFAAVPQSKTEPHYGIRWDGEHTTALQALLDDPAKIAITGMALLPKPVAVFGYRGATYLGVAPTPLGSLFLLK